MARTPVGQCRTPTSLWNGRAHASASQPPLCAAFCGVLGSGGVVEGRCGVLPAVARLCAHPGRPATGCVVGRCAGSMACVLRRVATGSARGAWWCTSQFVVNVARCAFWRARPALLSGWLARALHPARLPHAHRLGSAILVGVGQSCGCSAGTCHARCIGGCVWSSAEAARPKGCEQLPRVPRARAACHGADAGSVPRRGSRQFAGSASGKRACPRAWLRHCPLGAAGQVGIPTGGHRSACRPRCPRAARPYGSQRWVGLCGRAWQSFVWGVTSRTHQPPSVLVVCRGRSRVVGRPTPRPALCVPPRR